MGGIVVETVETVGAGQGRDLLVGPIFVNAATAVPTRPAVVLGRQVLTFDGLNRRANQLARALARRGVGPGERVVTLAGTALEMPALFAALAKIGAVFAPVNPTLAHSEVRRVVTPARPTLIVADRDRLACARRVAQDLACGVDLLEGLGEEADALDDAEPDVPPLSELQAHVIFFTSGSTGSPKGAVLTHRVNVLRTHPGALLERRGPLVSPYPLFHMGAWTLALQQWQARGTLVLVHSANAPEICAAITAHRAERINAIPGVWRRILDHLATGGGDVDLSSLRFADTGTSATPPELLTAMERALPGAYIRIFYGSTEAGSVAAMGHEDIHRKPGSCGTPAPHSELRVDGSGALWVRGPLVFDGYFDDPVATDDAVVDGWYRTGDLATLDQEGYLSIVGRAGSLIRTGGEPVVPTEVEEVLATHPSVADVAVVGVPDPQWGEVVCAAVVPVPGGPAPSLAELRTHCTHRLAAHQHPRRIVVVASIPRTPATQQVRRAELLAQIAAG